mmetsp:Transcript_14004/g.25516  ORF Transcript_14004/g.25516 Transcript_14004/m.25516 type:complete len:176 (-) Transcript_14004:675-1202(-)
MMPCNYIDLLTLDEQNSRILAGQKSHLGPHPKESSHEGYPAPSREQQPCQIQVNSTIDADIVLRRVIEDRAAILALTSRAATNEAELMKAKTRQLHITKILDRQDQEIAKLTTKAKCELVEYNEKCKQYITFGLSCSLLRRAIWISFHSILLCHLWKSLNEQSIDARKRSLKRYN